MFKKGFTLIELLVVIAIIAILAAILFPVFAQAREKARQTQCLSNVKQLGTATQLYVDDYDETLPPTAWTDAWPDTSIWGSYPRCNLAAVQDPMLGVSAASVSWADCLYPYVKNCKMFVCPSYTSKTSFSGWYTDRQLIGYGYSYVLSQWGTTCLAQMKQTAHTVFLGECTFENPSWCGGKISKMCLPEYYDYYKSYSNWLTGIRHNGGANFVMVDGHAKYCKDGVDILAHNSDGSMKAGWASDWWRVDLQN